MAMVDVREAGARLPELLARAEQGEPIIIARAGRPAARLVPVGQGRTREFGSMTFSVPDDFDDPIPEHELTTWA